MVSVRSVRVGVVAVGLLSLWGCSKAPPSFVSKPEPWRADEETVCLQSGYVRSHPHLVARSALGGPGHCGALQPFEMSAAVSGQVSLRPAALLRCPMVPAVEHWMRMHVVPAARRNYGLPIVEVKVAASYGCRPMNNVSGAKLSEHGHANALDVSAFILADGRQITVKHGWAGDPRERAFLRQVHQGACDTFTTVLGPNADANHHDHFHMDLARHGRNGDGRVCR